MQIKINNLPGYAAGSVIDIETDASGIPLDKFWRKRLKDAKIDQCIEVFKPSKKLKTEEGNK